MRNFTRNVVQNMSLRDTICGMCTNPTHNGTAITKEVAVEGGKGTTNKREFRSTVVGEKGVGVLEECD